MPNITELEIRVAVLSTRFLDHQISQEADLTFTPDLDAIAAFRLLVHAEIEEWLERYASDEIASLKAITTTTPTLRQSSRFIYLATLFEIMVTFELPFDRAKFEKQMNLVLDRATEFVKNNNGIKAGSFCKLAMICGACIDEVDVTLVEALNSYGKARGAVAHKSPSRVSTLNAPSAEKNQAINLVQLIKSFFSGLTPI